MTPFKAAASLALTAATLLFTALSATAAADKIIDATKAGARRWRDPEHRRHPESHR